MIPSSSHKNGCLFRFAICLMSVVVLQRYEVIIQVYHAQFPIKHEKSFGLDPATGALCANMYLLR